MEPLKMPHLALGDEAVTIVEWLRQPGDAFARGDVLLEVETSKATMEVDAPFAGVVATHLHTEGDEVEPGDVIAWCASVGEAFEESTLEALSASEGVRADAPWAGDGATPPSRSVDEARAALADDLATAQRPRLPLAEGGDLAGLGGETPRWARRSAPPLADEVAGTPPVPSGARAVLIQGRRAAIARQMTAGAAIPTFIVTRELLIPEGAGRLSDALVLAAARAAHQHPSINAWVSEDEIIELPDVDVSYAVDCPDGVVAPVIRAVQQLDLEQLAGRRRELVERAQAGTLRQSELTGGSITISNIGAVGADSVTAVLTAPQVAALGLGRVRDGVSGPMLTATLVADHRAVDGADGARFLVTLAEELAALIEAAAAA